MARTGTPYLALELRDRTGALPGARCSATPTCTPRASTAATSCAPRGRVARFRGELQVELTSDRARRAGTADPAAFLPVAYRDLDELDGFLDAPRRRGARSPASARCSPSVLGDDELRAALRALARARARQHHAYLGGLLEHTVAVATLAVETCTLHPRLDQDLLLTAALVHDLGRTRELTLGAEIGLSDEGRLLGHVELGLRMLERAARAAGLDDAAPARARALRARPTTARRAARSGASRCPRRSRCYRLNALDAARQGRDRARACGHDAAARPARAAERAQAAGVARRRAAADARRASARRGERARRRRRAACRA